MNETTPKIFIPRPYLLRNSIQPYEWGTCGEDAFIPKLLGMNPEPQKAYAELWIGVHPNAPSKVALEGKYPLLSDLITQYPNEILGKTVAAKFTNRLPFLFKVLSAGEPLSIQAHPTKKQAEALHLRDPKNYPDNNHKPELAIVLDNLEALVGLRSWEEIGQVLGDYPDLAGFVGRRAVLRFKKQGKLTANQKEKATRYFYIDLLRRSLSYSESLKISLEQLEKRLLQKTSPLSEMETLFLSLKKKYSADVGLFSLFLLNHVKLRAGQAIFLPAGVPHAYLKGNIIECMANSDNVVRAGLTSKFIDIQALIDILIPDAGQVKIGGSSENLTFIDYGTAAHEFRVQRYRLSPKKNLSLTEEKNSGQILLITDGRIRLLWRGENERRQEIFSKGQSILLPACLQSFTIQVEEFSEIFRVYVPA